MRNQTTQERPRPEQCPRVVLCYRAASVLLCFSVFLLFFFNDTATTEIYTPLYTLSLHDALPISTSGRRRCASPGSGCAMGSMPRSEEHTSELQSHSGISYAVFCLKKKKSNTYNQASSRRTETTTSIISSTKT